jgi:hypothetical protein
LLLGLVLSLVEEGRLDIDEGSGGTAAGVTAVVAVLV